MGDYKLKGVSEVKECTIKKYGNSAHITFPKKYIGKVVQVIFRDEGYKDQEQEKEKQEKVTEEEQGRTTIEQMNGGLNRQKQRLQTELKELWKQEQTRERDAAIQEKEKELEVVKINLGEGKEDTGKGAWD